MIGALVIFPSRLSDGAIPSDIASGGWWSIWAIGVVVGAVIWARRDR